MFLAYSKTLFKSIVGSSSRSEALGNNIGWIHLLQLKRKENSKVPIVFSWTTDIKLIC